MRSRVEQGEEFLGGDLFAGFLGGFFQNRVLDDFLGDHLLKLQPVKLEHGDHLNQAGGQDLLLGDPELE